MKTVFFIIPIASAALGWIFHRLVLSITFTPNNLRNWTQQLSIPLDNSNIIPFQKISDSISSPEQIQKIMPLIEVHIDDFLNNKLSKEMPMISMFIGDKTIGKLKGTFLNEIEKMLPAVLSKFTDNLSTSIKPGSMLAQKFNEMSNKEIDSLSRSFLGKLSSKIALLGLLTGLITGSISALLFYFLQ
jgi:hypothetical protein